jgi:1-hydroxycarotenoid 3,4-desaturase
MLVAHVEQDGVWLVRGGMHRIAQAMVRMAGARGARFRFDAPVREILIRDGRACGVRLADGEELCADAVIFNGEPTRRSPAGCWASGVPRGPPGPTTETSLSALT